jgi:catalase
MTPAKHDPATPLSRNLLKALDDLSGLHPGYRPAHAKGILLSGEFVPSPAANDLTLAPHIQRKSTPVTLRFSNSTGVPSIPDNDPNAGPRGIAVRFHLAEHSHTDIIAHSVNRFPARTAEEFLEFLRAAYASASATSHPTPVESFLATHPAALAFVQAPKPMPVSFARESFYAVNAYRFRNQSGDTRYGRYRIRPAEGSRYLSAEAAAAKPPDFLFDEIRERVASGPVRLDVAVQVAADGDVVDDSTIQWPEDRPQITFGTIQLSAVTPDNEGEQRHIIFDPIPRVDGIESSGDPLLAPRADLYLMSGRRRRIGETKP